MRIIANESHIETRTKLGEWAPLAGLIVLAISTAIIFVEPSRIWISMILVWIGFLISIIGSYLGNRYVGPMAYHKKVPEALKGMTDDYTLLIYMLPAPFVLVEPGGLTTITVKAHGGEVKYEKKSWRHREKFGFLRRLAGQETLGRAHRFALSEAESLQKYLDKRLPEDIEMETEAPVRPVLLFIHPDVYLEAENSPVPALRSAEFKRWLRKDGRRTRLPDETREKLHTVLPIEQEDEGEAAT
jgi:hypothetical protein